MLLYILAWIFVFVFIYAIGRIVAEIVKFPKELGGADIYFFTGLLACSVLTSWLSIFIPIDIWLLVIFITLTVSVLFLLKINIFSEIRFLFYQSIAIDRIEKAILVGIFTFVLLSVIGEIKNFDSGLYHMQNIKWIREYSVIPGLGNLHHRFAFNSMFFPISALFTFESPAILGKTGIVVYPLNSVCFLVLTIRVYADAKTALLSRKLKDFIFFSTILILGLFIFKKSLNSPSPDIITATLVIYIFFTLINRGLSKISLKLGLLLSGLTVLCISFKLSAFFLMMLVPLFLIKKRSFGAIGTMIGLGFIVIVPYVIRNYFLSGYVIYPFEYIDVFEVEWKLPLEKLVHESKWITSWARIPYEDYQVVLKKSFFEWSSIWFQNLKPHFRLLVFLQFYLLYDLIINLYKRDYSRVLLVTVLFVNLVFWFVKAPDPRFAYGFLILGAAIAISSLLIFIFHRVSGFRKHFSNFENRKLKNAFSILCLMTSFLFISKKAINYGIVPSPVKSVVTQTATTNFTYYIPTNTAKCFNENLPCTPYLNERLIKRGETFQEGFRIK